MKTSLMILGLIVAVAMLTVVALPAAEAPVAGTKAPDFTLKSQEGTNVSLKDFRGKWVVLYFYPKDFTQGCTIEAHNFQVDQPKYDKLNAAIVGVSVDTVPSIVTSPPAAGSRTSLPGIWPLTRNSTTGPLLI